MFITRHADSPCNPLRARALAGLAVIAFVGVALAPVFFPAIATAEQKAWVRSDITLNVRSGPSTEFRILSKIRTGDPVRVVERGNGWTRVQLPDDSKGWIPEGYLDPKTPPIIDLARLESEVTELRRELTSTRSESDGLRDANASMTSETRSQKTQLDDLKIRVARLQAGQGHPEMIAGASILVVGVLIGILIGRSSSRRRSTRIRM